LYSVAMLFHFGGLICIEDICAESELAHSCAHRTPYLHRRSTIFPQHSRSPIVAEPFNHVTLVEAFSHRVIISKECLMENRSW